jgi:hypothetical protein
MGTGRQSSIDLEQRKAHRLSSYDDANLHALRELPSVRPGKVARARALVNDPSYPSPEILRRIALLLVGKIH